MIGRLSGIIVDKPQPGKLVIDVHGVGYDVETSLQTFIKLDTLVSPTLQPIELHIHTIVREDALLLYGFIDKDERLLFRALIKINGVGPKVAMGILSSVSPQEFIQCISTKNIALLTQLPGIGKKTAERLLIEMKDSVLPSNAYAPVQSQEEAASALVALGYKPQEALKVIKKIDTGDMSCEQLIRKALQMLSVHA